MPLLNLMTSYRFKGTTMPEEITWSRTLVNEHDGQVKDLRLIDRQLVLDVIAELAAAAQHLDHGLYTSGDKARELIQHLKVVLHE